MPPNHKNTKDHEVNETSDFVVFCELVSLWLKNNLQFSLQNKFTFRLSYPVIIFLLLVITIQSFAQEPEPKVKEDVNDITDKIENIAQSTDETLDYSDLINDLIYFRENPLNLNYASMIDLEKLFFLNEMQIFNLIAYRETYGHFLTVFELQSIDGFDTESIQKILPYVYVSEEKPVNRFKFKDLTKYGRHEAIVRYQRVLQEQKGYTSISDSALYASPNSRYLGSPDKIYLKYGYNFHDRVRFGFLAEKDAGEVFLTENVNDSIQRLIGDRLKNGFDFYSFYFSLHDIGILKAVTVGDYQLGFGQGLTLSSGLAFGKSAEAVDLKRNARGIKTIRLLQRKSFFQRWGCNYSLRKIRPYSILFQPSY